MKGPALITDTVTACHPECVHAVHLEGDALEAARGLVAEALLQAADRAVSCRDRSHDATFGPPTGWEAKPRTRYADASLDDLGRVVELANYLCLPGSDIPAIDIAPRHAATLAGVAGDALAFWATTAEQESDFESDEDRAGRLARCKERMRDARLTLTALGERR